jgi:ferredoxin
VEAVRLGKTDLMVSPLWEGWPPDWCFSWGYVKNAVESAQNCVQCGECEEKCPYKLPIRGMIVENLAFHERVAAEYGRRGRS